MMTNKMALPFRYKHICSRDLFSSSSKELLPHQSILIKGGVYVLV